MEIRFTKNTEPQLQELWLAQFKPFVIITNFFLLLICNNINIKNFCPLEHIVTDMEFMHIDAYLCI